MKPNRVLILLLLAIAVVIVIHRFSSSDRSYSVRTLTIKLDSLEQIEVLSDSLVKPVLYTQVSGLDQLDSEQAKSMFISVLLPSVLVAKHQVKEDSIKLERLIKKNEWSPADSTFYLDMADRFKAESLANLKLRLGTLPNSMVLAQAAVESGWGRSRFFLEGNNVFGIWSYRENEPRMQAGVSRGNSPVFVKVYENIYESIIDYFEVIGSVRAYRSLRQARLLTNDPFVLLPHLKYYSERRTSYTDQLRSVIIQNNLTRYDAYRIDPRYLVRK